jgi:hypothetical protein
MRQRGIGGAGRSRATLGLIAVILIGGVPAHLAAAQDSWWMPGVGITWQIQLNRPPTAAQIIPGLDAYEIDLFETTPQRIAEIKATGASVICYFSAGSYENWRPDRRRFPQRAIGNPLEGWPGERWLDIRHPKVRRIMHDRLDLAVRKGCDAVDPDNVEGYQHDSGFPLNPRHQLSFNRFLANEAHRRGLAIGLKNDLPQIPQLVNWFDFAVNEECFRYDECGRLRPFIVRGKPVLSIEYPLSRLVANRVCPRATPLGFSTLIKKLSLDSARYACPVQPVP